MNYSKNDYRRNWYKWLISLLENVSSKEFQLRVWINGMGPEVDCYSESITQYFDDLNLNDGLEVKVIEKFITKNEYEILKSFHDRYQKFVQENKRLYSDKFTEEDLNSPEWTDVTELAKKTVDELKQNNRK